MAGHVWRRMLRRLASAAPAARSLSSWHVSWRWWHRRFARSIPEEPPWRRPFWLDRCGIGDRYLDRCCTGVGWTRVAWTLAGASVPAPSVGWTNDVSTGRHRRRHVGSADLQLTYSKGVAGDPRTRRACDIFFAKRSACRSLMARLSIGMFVQLSRAPLAVSLLRVSMLVAEGQVVPLVAVA